jgi:hypothetical protein
MELTATPEQLLGLEAIAKRDGYSDALTYMQAQLDEHARVGNTLIIAKDEIILMKKLNRAPKELKDQVKAVVLAVESIEEPIIDIAIPK